MFNKGTISRKVLIRVLKWSLVIALALSILEVVIWYTEDIELLEQRMDAITDSRSASLAAGLWNVDNEQIEIILNEITRLQDVDYIMVHSTEDSRIFYAGIPAGEANTITRNSELVYMSDGKPVLLGSMSISKSLDSVYSRFSRNTLIILFAELVKTFLIAIIVMLIIHGMLTQHLISLAAYLKDNRAKNSFTPFKLPRKKQNSHSDELDEVVSALNNLFQNQLDTQHSLQQHRDHLEEMVDERTAQLRQSMEDAQKANQAKSDFLSHMSHELRTPLTPIIGFSQFMLHQDDFPQQYRENMLSIQKSGNHLLSLINDLLDLAKIEAGKFELFPENIKLGETVDDCLAMNQALADKRGIELCNKLGANADSTIFADKLRFKQVLLNLVSNAIKYNRENGTVEIGAKTGNNNQLAIYIRDTGAGLDQQQIDRLFNPFDRAGAENSGVEGTGIGLSISKNLVELMGGNISIESEVNVGSTFWVEMPSQTPAEKPVV